MNPLLFMVGKENVVLVKKMLRIFIFFLSLNFLFWIYLYFNPEPCPPRQPYKLSCEGRVTGFYVDCTKNMSEICFISDTAKNKQAYTIYLGGYYICLLKTIEVNDKIIITKGSNNIVLIKPHGKHMEFQPDCFSKPCSCDGRSVNMPSSTVNFIDVH